MDYEQLFQVAATGDQQALAELDRRLESEPRQVDYDYELRHPGRTQSPVISAAESGNLQHKVLNDDNKAAGWKP
jgi:hypothetical protein